MLRNEVKAAYRRTVPPSADNLAVTLPEIKSKLQLLDADCDGVELMRIAQEATEQVERDARRVIMPQTWQQHLDRFPCHEIELRKVPIQSLTHVKYITGGVLTTLSPTLYEIDLISEPARIRPKWNTTWPCTDCTVNAVQIEWVAGYATAADVPAYLKGVILSVIYGSYHGCDMGDNYWPMIERLQTFGFMR